MAVPATSEIKKREEKVLLFLIGMGSRVSFLSDKQIEKRAVAPC
jgi:hypothetical protein